MENEEQVTDIPEAELGENEEELESFDDIYGETDAKEETEAEDTTENEEKEETDDSQTEEVDETEVKTEETTEAEEYLELKYNHEEKKISKTEAKELAQKGLNYDKLKERIESLESSPELTYLDKKAKENGMNREDYIKAVEQYDTEQQIQKEKAELDKLLSQGVSRDVAEKLSSVDRFAKELKIKEAEQAEREKAIAVKESKKAEMDSFIEAFPTVKADDIPKEVLVKSEKVGLKNAYTEYALAEARKELDLLKTNKENKAKAPITGVTEHGGIESEVSDDEMDGFNSVF